MRRGYGKGEQPMDKTIDTSDEGLSLIYWQADLTFGELAVRNTLADPRWSETYPEIIAQARSANFRTHNDAILPGAVIRAIAERDDCKNAFVAYPDGVNLVGIEKKNIANVVARYPGARLIPAPEALLSYGAYCLFRACDSSFGEKGEKDNWRLARSTR